MTQWELPYAYDLFTAAVSISVFQIYERTVQYRVAFGFQARTHRMMKISCNSPHSFYMGGEPWNFLC